MVILQAEDCCRPVAVDTVAHPSHPGEAKSCGEIGSKCRRSPRPATSLRAGQIVPPGVCPLYS